MSKRWLAIRFLFPLTFLIASCGGPGETTSRQTPAGEPAAKAPQAVTAVAQLNPTEGNSAAGRVLFTQQQDGVHIVADLTGLSEGRHGFHIHENGDCSAPDATSAGGHFNPENSRHGAPTDSEHHAGDLGNIEAAPDGTAHLEMVAGFITLGPGANSIVGKAVIVHAGEDDLQTQPTGNAGARVACGVIKLQ